MKQINNVVFFICKLKYYFKIFLKMWVFTHLYYALIGDDCELDENACAESPCVHGRTCIDLTATEELRLGRGYNCSDCPTGFADIDNKCQGI